MDDTHANEQPLNLVKKKKPVAVVAPSAVNEDKYVYADKSDDATLVSVGNDDDEGIKCDDDDGATNSADTRSGPSNQGYSSAAAAAFLSSAPYDPNFLTNLYMNSLMTAGYLNNNYAYPGPAQGAGAYSYHNGFAAAAAAAAAASSPQINGNLSNFWAQQRFWQMVNWHEAQRKAELAKTEDGLDAAVSLSEPLKVAIPTFSNSTERSEAKESPRKGVKSKKKHSLIRYGFLQFMVMGLVKSSFQERM